MAADYPASVVAYGQEKFHKASALGKSTLSGGIDAAVTSFSVADATVVATWPAANFLVRIENELVFCGSRSGNNVSSAVRARAGTTAASHALGVEVRVVLGPVQIEKIEDEIIAMQGWPLSATATQIASKAFADSPYTLLATDWLVLANAASGAITINLPTAVGIEGRTYALIKTDSSVNAVTLDGNAAETINGKATHVLDDPFDGLLVISDGANWQALAFFAAAFKSVYNKTAAPTVGDDADDGYVVGSRWVDVTNDRSYVLVDATAGAAVWRETSGLRLRKNSGGSDFRRGRANLIEGPGITLTVADDSVNDEVDTTITATSGYVLETVNQTSPDKEAADGKLYVVTTTGITPFILPTTAAVGFRFRIAGAGTQAWRLKQNASQKIHFGDLTTTTGTGGKIEATHKRDCLEVVCVVADTEFEVMSSMGQPTVV